MNILEFLRRQFHEALGPITPRAAEYARLVTPAQQAAFGDYQANCAMPLKKELGGNPRQIAQNIIERLPDPSLFAKVEIAGPGFINLSLADDWIAERLAHVFADASLGIEPSAGVMIVDYSSPNVAKPMHVGHIRSTIIGDAICRIFRARGWKVFSDNHLGDWGTQFGMLIFGYRHCLDQTNWDRSPIDELARLYRTVNELAEKDPSVADAARRETAKLHEGDPENVALWNMFMPHCLADLQRVYDRLGIRHDYTHGESHYQPLLAAVVDDLVARKIAVESEGAICIFFPDPSGKIDEEGKPVQLLPPAIVRKTDGAFTYATSDLACIRERCAHDPRPDSIVYVVDDRQALHFKQLFNAARKWGYDQVALTHVAFGKITGKDGKPFKTREGGTIHLEDLLDEAVLRARKVVDESSADLPEDERSRISEVVGIGAVKYADLSQNRTSDYVFDWDKMISLQGNTAAYVQYAYSRTRNIFREGGIDPETCDFGRIGLDHPRERALGLQLLQFPEALELAADDFKPNQLTNYLFGLANAFNNFYHECKVLKAETPELKSSRLALCELTGRTIRRGLDLLGIRVVDRM